MDRRRVLKLTAIACSAPMLEPIGARGAQPGAVPGLWGLWDSAFATARYVSLSHVLGPHTPLWKGFRGTARFQPAEVRFDDQSDYAPVAYEKSGFEATAYTLPTDQFGTQLDPPAHWHQCYPAIDELPATLALRKLAVISIVEAVNRDPNYHLSIADIESWEARNGRLPAGIVVMVRSDWSKRWPDRARVQPADARFPGVSLEALKFLHLDRQILLHGHEPLDTDSTSTLVGEDWLMNNGYMQAEGVANLDLVPETGALVAIGFPRFKGGTGGLASFTAICPSHWPHGQRPGETAEAPLSYQSKRLVWNAGTGTRERGADCDKPQGKLSFN